MKKELICLVVLAVLAGGCSTNSTPTAAAQVEPTLAPADNVEAEGKLIPDPGVELAFMQTGVVAEVDAAAGQKVVKGQVLARLVGYENAKASLETAKAGLMNAEQALTDLKRAGLQSTGDTGVALKEARKAYDREASGWSIGNRDDATDLELALDDYIQAEKDVHEGWQDVIDLLGKDETNPKRMNAESDLKRNEASLADAYTRLQQAAGRQTIPMEEKQAKIMAAIGKYEQVRAADSRIGVDGVDQEKLELAQAAVDAAQANLSAARETAGACEITAPFDGTLLSINLNQGETAPAGAPAAYLADPIHWTVETKDLAEVDINRVAVGQKAVVKLDGLPGETFGAKVTKINPVGREYLGDMTYQVTLTLDQPDPRFLWNMTAVVTIQTGK